MLQFKALFFHLYLIWTCAIAVTLSANPTIVIVPGAWHQPMHYAIFKSLLQRAGYSVVVQANPSLNSATPKETSTSTDAAFIRNSVLLPLINDGKSVVLIMHSYGGSPGAAAAYGLSKRELQTQKGHKGGGVVGLIFMAAFLAPKGASLLSQLPGGEYRPWTIPNYTTGQLEVAGAKDVFYADVRPPTDTWAIAQILKQSEHALSSPSGPPAWAQSAFKGQLGYIFTLQDQAIVLPAQRAMVANSGVAWAERSLNTGHSPFLSQPAPLTQAVQDLLREFSK